MTAAFLPRRPRRPAPSCRSGQGLVCGLAALAVVCGAGCSSSSVRASADASTGGADTSTDASGDAASSEDADAAPSCAQGCPASTTPNTVCVAQVQASLVDTHGAPIAGENLLVCGDNLCSLPGRTDAQGKTSIFLCEAMVLPALKFLGGADFVSFASAVSQETSTFAPITLFSLPATGPAFPAAGGTVTSGPVSLQVAANAVTFDSSQANDPTLQVFLAAQVDVAKVPPGLDPALGIKAVWGLAPVNATLTPPGSLTIPNSAAWMAGAKVDFYMNGVDPIPSPPAPYGAWGAVGTGTVSQDGKTITTDPGAGNGIPVLSMVGVRLHP